MIGAKPQRPSADDAEAMALQGLTFLVSDADRLSRFMALTGIALDEIRTDAGSRVMQVAVIEYLLSDESLLLTFCAEARLAPESMAPAHALLAG